MQKFITRLSMVYFTPKEYFNLQGHMGKIATLLVIALIAASASAASGKGAGLVP